eukprot:scaffold20690_cov155-Skeletonema_dohrnii-CCMP3373.AAC.6
MSVAYDNERTFLTGRIVSHIFGHRPPDLAKDATLQLPVRTLQVQGSYHECQVRRTGANDLVSGHSPEQDLGQNMAKWQVLHSRCVYQVVMHER